MKRIGKWLYKNYDRNSMPGNRRSSWSHTIREDEMLSRSEPFDHAHQFDDENTGELSAADTSVSGDQFDPFLAEQRMRLDEMDRPDSEEANASIPEQVMMLSIRDFDMADDENHKEEPAWVPINDNNNNEEEEEEEKKSKEMKDEEELPEAYYYENHVFNNKVATIMVEEDATQHLLHEGYGKPLSQKQAETLMPDSDKGLAWSALLIPDNYCDEKGRLMRDLNKKDFDPVTKGVRPQRPTLPVTYSEFRSSLTQTEDRRWIFHGILNGWPGLRTLEVVGLQVRRSRVSLTVKDLLHGNVYWGKVWSKKRGYNPNYAHEDSEPFEMPSDNGLDWDKVWREGRVYRVKLKGPSWTGVGWSPASPGFLYWFEWHEHRLTYGTNVLETVDANAQCTMVHMISHRYAIAKETTRDKLTYHSVVLLEWDHGRYCTVVEGAFLNGIAGYKGMSNWYHDKNAAGGSRLYHSFPPETIAPWFTKAAEIRCLDVEAKNLAEFKEFIAQYNGNTQRFVDPHVSFSHPTRLSYRSKVNIARYLLNYIGRDSSYMELKRNCQTLAADVCGFLCGKKNVEPFHPISRIEYRNKSYMFLYEPSMFTTDKTKEEKKK